MALVNPKVFFVMSVDNKPAGRIVMELYATTPLAAENFRALCTGEKGIGLCGKPLHYKGSLIAYIARDLMWYCGDFSNGDRTGNESIYGLGFPHENFTRKHDRPGVLTMTDCGKDNNGSVFQIVMREMPSFDGKQVVVGQVVEGLEVIKKIEEMVTSPDSHTPSKPVRILNCGQMGCPSQTDVGVLFASKFGPKLRVARRKIAELENAKENGRG
ncbi:unnamed protein product [Microthlaspi erraticum]|uniref:Peptidyl-prolyl cis-trans isomerase n=1 Tax=Microthlaspi erraticum TaxID=1685480 RepID=A0A6D2I4J0_9BRAS|nr:unnamed protein product [Microthlaspi erraticum]